MTVTPSTSSGGQPLSPWRASPLRLEVRSPTQKPRRQRPGHRRWNLSTEGLRGKKSLRPYRTLKMNLSPRTIDPSSPVRRLGARALRSWRSRPHPLGRILFALKPARTFIVLVCVKVGSATPNPTSHYLPKSLE